MEQEAQARRAAVALRERADAVADTEVALAALLAAPPRPVAEERPVLGAPVFDVTSFDERMVGTWFPGADRSPRRDGDAGFEHRHRWMMAIAAAVVLVAIAVTVVAARSGGASEPLSASQPPPATSVPTVGAKVHDGAIDLPNGLHLAHLPNGTVLERLTTNAGTPGTRVDSVAELALPNGTTLRVTLTDTAPAWPRTPVVIGDEMGYTGWCDWCALSAGTPARHVAVPVSGAWLIAETLSPDPLSPEPATDGMAGEQRVVVIPDSDSRPTARFDDLTAVLEHAVYSPALDARTRT